MKKYKYYAIIEIDNPKGERVRIVDSQREDKITDYKEFLLRLFSAYNPKIVECHRVKPTPRKKAITSFATIDMGQLAK